MYPVGQQGQTNLHTRGNAIAPCDMGRNRQKQRCPIRSINRNGQGYVLPQRQTFDDRPGYRILLFTAGRPVTPVQHDVTLRDHPGDLCARSKCDLQPRLQAMPPAIQ